MQKFILSDSHCPPAGVFAYPPTQRPPAGSWRVEESWLEAGVILKKCSPSHSLDERPHGCQDKH